MREKLFNLFCKIFEGELNAIKNGSRNEMRQEIMNAREEFQKVEQFNLIGKPVICISNEWANPSVGFVKEVEFMGNSSSPLLIVHDYVSNEIQTICGKSFQYTEQRLNAILKLDPFEACSLVFNYTAGTFDKEKSGVRDSNETILKKLTQNGFFEKLESENKEVEMKKPKI